MEDDLQNSTAVVVMPASDAEALTPEDIAASAPDADAIRAALTNIGVSRWVIARRLNDVRNRLGYGKYLRWLEHEKLGRCDRQVRIDIQIMRAFKSESDSDLDLIGVTALKTLSAPTVPPAARQEAFQETKKAAQKSGRKGVVSKAREIAAEHKKTAPASKGKTPRKSGAPKASSLEPRPPVSQMINSFEIDRLISPKLKSIKTKAKKVAQSQISTDIILAAEAFKLRSPNGRRKVRRRAQIRRR
jgi:hypothetical protein